MSVADKVATLLSSASAEPAPETPAGAPPTGAAISGAGSAPAGGESPAPPASSAAATDVPPPAGAPTTPEEQHRAILEAKLAKVRADAADRRAAHKGARTAADAERLRAEAEADRKAAANEKDSLSKALRAGSFLETVKALGKDPAAAFREMQEEAVKAGTPEAQLAKMREDFAKELADVKGKLDASEKARADDKARADEEAHAAHFASDFRASIVDPTFAELRIEYGDARLLAHADSLRRDSSRLFESAKALGVRLTDPGKGFTMREILSVLKAAQDEHERGKTERRAAITASNQRPPAQAGSEKPPVNGTAAKRNAGATTIGNDLASSRASDGKAPVKGSTSRARVAERARRLYGGPR